MREFLPSPDADHLTVQVEGDRCEPLRLVMIARPGRDGMVRVREWAGDNWTAGPVEREVATDELYESFERAQRARRKVSEELYRIRLWLDGIDR